MFGGVLLVIVIYVLVNLALIHVLPMSQLAGEPLAVGAVARVIFGRLRRHGDSRAGDSFAAKHDQCLHLECAANSLCDELRRIVYASRQRELTRGGTPTITLFISTIVAVALHRQRHLQYRSWQRSPFSLWLITRWRYISVFVLRRREPDLPRPYRAWGYPWTTLDRDHRLDRFSGRRHHHATRKIVCGRWVCWPPVIRLSTCVTINGRTLAISD